jgi:hypothetical protein
VSDNKHCFPQTPAKDENFNRTGGLTKLELAMILLAPSVFEQMGAIRPTNEFSANLKTMTSACTVLEALAEMILITAEKARTRLEQ